MNRDPESQLVTIAVDVHRESEGPAVGTPPIQKEPTETVQIPAPADKSTDTPKDTKTDEGGQMVGEGA